MQHTCLRFFKLSCTRIYWKITENILDISNFPNQKMQEQTWKDGYIFYFALVRKKQLYYSNFATFVTKYLRKNLKLSIKINEFINAKYNIWESKYMRNVLTKKIVLSFDKEFSTRSNKIRYMEDTEIFTVKITLQFCTRKFFFSTLHCIYCTFNC